MLFSSLKNNNNKQIINTQPRRRRRRRSGFVAGSGWIRHLLLSFFLSFFLSFVRSQLSRSHQIHSVLFHSRKYRQVSVGHMNHLHNNNNKMTATTTRRQDKDDAAAAAVEELLQSAQDDILLKLSLDSHISRRTNDYLPPDLSRRFHALKALSSSSAIPEQPQKSQDDGDLQARFAALKARGAAAPPLSPGLGGSGSGLLVVDKDDEEEEMEEDEVEKIIRWAKDAARLDPSPPSDSDDEDDDVNVVVRKKQ